MPSWKIHNKWAKKLIPNMPKKDLNLVNRLIDEPKKVKEFMEFFIETSSWFPDWKKVRPEFPLSEDYIKKEIISTKDELHNRILNQLLQLHHDSGRKKNPLGGHPYKGLAAFVQLKFLSLKGSGYVKAWYLHHFLDYMWYVGHFPPKEVFERLRHRLIYCPEFDEVKSFVKKYWGEILQDLGY